MGVQVMNRVLPEDSVVGSWDAGVIGYFSRFPVVNLDGLGNSYGYLRALREGTEVTFYPRYGITHFATSGPLWKEPRPTFCRQYGITWFENVENVESARAWARSCSKARPISIKDRTHRTNVSSGS